MISTNALALYNNLMKLCEPDQATKSKFYYTDHLGMPHAGQRVYRIFDYHIASYSDWALDDARQCRGMMFEINTAGEAIRVASKTPLKFFNLNECPFTMGLDLTKIDQIMDKADGSLISTYLDGAYLRLKSKASLTSQQALDAMKYLVNHPKLAQFLQYMAENDYTVNMEWTSPSNRVVLGYEEDKLIILNIIHNQTGEYLEFDEIQGHVYNTIKDYLVDEYNTEIAQDPNFVSSIKSQVGIEGIVFRIGSLYCKLKTDWYVQLHSNKDSINNDKRLVLTILDGNHDDLRSLFHDDQMSLQRINEFEASVVSGVHEAAQKIQAAYDANRGKERKFYAIDGRKTLSIHQGMLFGIYMNMFEGAHKMDLYESVSEMFKRNPELLIPEKYK